MNISIGNDHAGPKYKKEIILFLEKKGYSVINHGTNNDQSVDYPDFIHPVAHDVSSKKADFGIIICGSGNGAAMTANNFFICLNIIVPFRYYLLTNNSKFLLNFYNLNMYKKTLQEVFVSKS